MQGPGPPLLNILCALLATPRSQAHQPRSVRTEEHKEIACKLSEKFHHTEHGATQR